MINPFSKNKGQDKSKAKKEVRQRTLSATEAASVIPSRPPAGRIAQMLKLLNHCDPFIREGTIKSLARLGGQHAQTGILTCMDDPDPRVRSAVFKAIGRLRMHDSAEFLLKALKDDDEETVRCAAAAGLGLLGDISGLEMVLRLANPKHPLRWEALRSINDITRQKFPVNAEGLRLAIEWVNKHRKSLAKST